MTHFVQPTKYAAIGMIRKIKGLKGEMVVSLTYPKVRLEDDRFFFFYLYHTYVPYRVDSWEMLEEYGLLRLAGIEDRQQAIVWQGHTLYVAETLVKQALAKTDYGLIGYRVIDHVMGEMGEVVSLIRQPLYSLLCVAYQGKEVLIPLHKDIVQQIDKKAKKVNLILPQGYETYFL